VTRASPPSLHRCGGCATSFARGAASQHRHGRGTLHRHAGILLVVLGPPAAPHARSPPDPGAGLCNRPADNDKRGRAGPPEEHDVRLWSVDGVVHPASALLDANRPPLVLHASQDDGEPRPGREARMHRATCRSGAVPRTAGGPWAAAERCPAAAPRACTVAPGTVGNVSTGQWRETALQPARRATGALGRGQRC